MDAVSGFVSRLRRPEYVAENRCVPCTVANLGIAAVVSVAAGLAVWSTTTAPAGVATAAVVLAVSGAGIYLRGYLVPGTPALTERYFPRWLLDVFDKEPVIQDDTTGDVDQEAILVGVGALEECRDGTDLCLVDEFRRAWLAEIDRIEAESAYEELLSVVAVDRGEVTVEEHGSTVQAQVDGSFAGVWKSSAAFHADLGSAAVLSDRLPNWDALDPHDRHAILAGLRLFLDECPDCGGATEMGRETVETCCAAREVMAVDCADCGARLFETAVDG